MHLLPETKMEMLVPEKVRTPVSANVIFSACFALSSTTIRTLLLCEAEISSRIG